MGSGSELDVIFGHLRTKMEAKFDLKAVLRRSWGVLRRSWGDLGPEEGDKGKKQCLEQFENIAGTGGPRTDFISS